MMNYADLPDDIDPAELDRRTRMEMEAEAQRQRTVNPSPATGENRNGEDDIGVRGASHR